MKTFTTPLLTNIQSKVSTLTSCIEIRRKDNTYFRYTNYNTDLVIDGYTYKGNASFTPTSYTTTVGLAPDNFDITGIVDDLGITDEELFNELFYNAEVKFFAVDYTSPNSGKNKLLRGTLGTVKITDTSFVVEFRNMSQRLNQTISKVFSKTCRAKFGDASCGVVIDVPVWEASTAYVLDDVVKSVTFNNRYFKCTTAGTSDVSEPSWDTTLDNTTADNTVVWTCIESKIKEGAVSSLTVGIEKTIKKVEIILTAPDISTNEASWSEVIFTGINGDVDVTATGYSTLNILNPTNMFDGNSGTFASFDNTGLEHVGTITFDTPVDFHTVTIENFTPESTIPPDLVLKVICYDNTNNEYTIYNGNPISGTMYIPVAPINSSLSNNIFMCNITGIDIDYFKNGKITWLTGKNAGTEQELNYFDSAGRVSLQFPTPWTIEVTDTFKVQVGCNKLFLGSDGTTATGDCITKYNNGINFRGEPYIKTEDDLLNATVTAE